MTRWHSLHIINRYIRELINAIVRTNICWNIGGAFYNILAYANDVVLSVPNCRALQLFKCLVYVW